MNVQGVLILFVGTVQFLSGPQHCYVPADDGPRSLKYGGRALSALYIWVFAKIGVPPNHPF